MNPPRRIIRSIQWSDDGVAIEYMSPAEDLKANGVTLNHVLVVPAGDDYDDELEALTESAHFLLEDVLEDVPRLEAISFDDPDDDDDED